MFDKTKFALVILGALFLSGCTPNTEGIAGKPKNTPAQAPSATKSSLVSGLKRGNQDLISVDQFVEKAGQMQAAGQAGRLQRLVARFPDVALQSLRETSPQLAQKAERQAIAASYDKHFVTQSTSGWQATLITLAAHPESHQAAFEGRIRVRSYIEQGRFDVAAKTNVPGDNSEPALPKADLLRLRGIAWFLDNQFEPAIASWQRALAIADFDACIAIDLNLLISEASRKSGRVGDQVAAWKNAANYAAGVQDPDLWERLIDLRPSESTWPESIQSYARQQMMSSSSNEPQKLVDDGLVWNLGGELRLERSEASSALLAFTHAAATLRDQREKAEARVGQARALIAMGRRGPSISILTSVSQGNDPSAAAHAFALMGVIEIQNGQAAEGMKLLQRTVEHSGNVRWPGFSHQTDLGLAYLAVGQEEQGMKLLHEGQEAFRKEGRLSDLGKCLSNEAGYYQRSGHPERATTVLSQLSELENNPTALH